jgi:hypothetical protein
MNLVTLIAACALSIEPTIMHALIWEQSGGKPWSFSLPGESQPRVYSTLRDAVREAREMRPNDGGIRIGLTGLSTAPRSATAAIFAPCRNITFAARQITRFAERCKTKSGVPADPYYCGIAAYRGSWERPDAKFADAVRATVERADAPNLDMPKDAYFDGTDIAFEAATDGPNIGSTTPAGTRDDRERGWSSALFPAKAVIPNGPRVDVPTRGAPAAESRSTDHISERATTTNAPDDSLFVPRSTERRP